jgi:glucan phosphorylase
MTLPIKTLNVKPLIPETLKGVGELSRNLWFVWNYDAENLFRSMNPDLWEETRENPVELLVRLKQNELKGLATDEGSVLIWQGQAEFDRYMSSRMRGFSEKEKPFVVAISPQSAG